jgi:hypothetical protein
MAKSRVLSAMIDVAGQSYLANSPQPLEFGSVNNPSLVRKDFNEAVYGISEFEAL